MSRINVKKPDATFLDQDHVFSWPIWEKEISVFPWTYESMEECYFLEGRVTVRDENTGESVTFGKGDFVTFPEGLSCTWTVQEPVRKHYRFS